MSEIKLSPKHGVNPTITICPICGKETSVALLGKISPEDPKAPRQMIDREPCDSCKKEIETYKKQGFVVFIIADQYELEMEKAQSNNSKNYPSPWQFFVGLNVLKLDAAERLFQNMDMSKKAAFISKSLAKQIGLKIKNYQSNPKSKNKKQSTHIQTLGFSKDYYNLRTVKQWIKKHKFHHKYGIDERTNSYKVRQFDPKLFKKNSFRAIYLAKGIVAFIGKFKK